MTMIKILLRDAIPFAIIRAYQRAPGARAIGRLIASGSTSQLALRAISEGVPGWRAIAHFARITRAGDPGSINWNTLGLGGVSWDQAPGKF